MVNDSPWSCHQVDHPSWLFRRWPLLEWSSTSPKPHSYPPSILTATHWMLLNDHKKSYCWTFHCSFRYFLTHIDAISASLPRLSMSCRLWVAVIPTIRKALHMTCPTNPQHPASTGRCHTLQLRFWQSTTRSLYLFIFRSWAYSNMSFSCWLQQKNTPAWGIPNNIIRSLIGNWFFLKKLSRPLRSACICQSPVVPIIYLKLLFLKFQRYMYLKYNLMKWLVGLGFDSWFGCNRSGV